ncbi:hypothetical protein VTL71DRAFT_52 [Oculimacula yallundae]|uniref:Uncharacterized protein n=1 Tax=Oculimacula yallundae TaxID=86028 RepID=A0ABR4CZ05_9HELO
MLFSTLLSGTGIGTGHSSHWHFDCLTANHNRRNWRLETGDWRLENPLSMNPKEQAKSDISDGWNRISLFPISTPLNAPPYITKSLDPDSSISGSPLSVPDLIHFNLTNIHQHPPTSTPASTLYLGRAFACPKTHQMPEKTQSPSKMTRLSAWGLSHPTASECIHGGMGSTSIHDPVAFVS